MLRTLGIGRFAEVVCAIRVGPAGFRRLVALKRPHADNPAAVERLLYEARIGGLLRHEAIVATLDVERDAAGWYLVLEYVDGPSLAAVVQRYRSAAVPGAAPERMPTGIAFALALTLCVGLAYAHAAVDEHGHPLELVHGDLSPANILLTSYGHLKIADFGGASSVHEKAGLRTGRGTLGFAPPEVVRGDKLDVRADVFAAGAIIGAIFQTTAFGDDPRLAAILARATAAERDDRHPDANTLAAALAAIRPPQDPNEPPLSLFASESLGHIRTDTPSELHLAESGSLQTRPYCGLESFTADSAALFFGRESDVVRISRRVRTAPFTVLTGPSGVGKSSLLAAGLPAMLPDFSMLHVRPGPDPMGTLARVCGISGQAFGTSVDRFRGMFSEPTIVVVDPAEDLFTQASPADALMFASALTALASDGLARVILAVRADHLPALCDLEPLRDVVDGSVEPLSTPGRKELIAALVRPLEPFGYRFENEALVERIAAALVGRAGALACLQLCADGLWQRRDTIHRVLRASELDGLGGVEGVLMTHTDNVIEALAPSDRAIARAILGRCLGGGARFAVPVSTLLEADSANAMTRAVLAHLVDARLLVQGIDSESGSTDGRVDEVVVEPAHEVLVAHWQQRGRGH